MITQSKKRIKSVLGKKLDFKNGGATVDFMTGYLEIEIGCHSTVQNFEYLVLVITLYTGNYSDHRTFTSNTDD